MRQLAFMVSESLVLPEAAADTSSLVSILAANYGYDVVFVTGKTPWQGLAAETQGMSSSNMLGVPHH